MSEQTVTRCMQLRLFIPKEAMSEMRVLMRECARARTVAMQAWRAADAGKRVGLPDDPPLVKDGKNKGKPDLKAIYGECPKVDPYKLLTGDYPTINTGIIGAITHEVRGKYCRERIRILLGKKRTPEWRDTTPIPIRDGRAKIKRQADGRFSLECGFWTRATKRGRTEIPIRFNPERLPPPWRQALDRYAAGQKIPRVLIHCRGTRLKRKWYVDIPYQVGVEQPKIIDGRILQVRRPIDGNGFLRCSWQPKGRSPRFVDIEYQSALPIGERNEALRRSMQNKYKCWREKSGRRGHGRKRAVEPFRKLTKKRANQQTAFNQNAARYILDMARRWKCGVIELEDLSAVLDKTTLVLGDWPYFQIKQRLRDLCEQYGLELQVVDPIEVITERTDDGDNEVEETPKRKAKSKRKGRKKDAA